MQATPERQTPINAGAKKPIVLWYS